MGYLELDKKTGATVLGPGRKPRSAKKPRVKNLCLKTRSKDDPYETWVGYGNGWTWHVLKKYQANDGQPFARWFCFVTSPMCPEGEYGDVYVLDIVLHARKGIQTY